MHGVLRGGALAAARGAGLALPIGLLMGARPRVYELLNPMVQIFRPIPPIAFIPLVMVAMNVVYSATAYPFGRLADRMPHRTLLLLGLAVLPLAALPLLMGGVTPGEVFRMAVVVTNALGRAADQVDCWLDHGLAKAMNQFNGAIDSAEAK